MKVLENIPGDDIGPDLKESALRFAICSVKITVAEESEHVFAEVDYGRMV